MARSRRFADPRDRRVRRGRSSARQLPLRVELRARSEATDAAQGAAPARRLFDLSRLARCGRCGNSTRLYTAPISASLTPRTTTTAPARMRVDRSHPRAGAHHHGRGRSVRAVGAIPDPGHRQSAHHARSARARGTLRVRRPPSTAMTTATGPRTRSSTSSTQEPAWLTDSRQPETFAQQPAELGPLSRFFVLEIDEHVAAARSFRARCLGPPPMSSGVYPSSRSRKYA